MKDTVRTALPRRLKRSTLLQDLDEDMRDVYTPTGPALKFLEIQIAFWDAGYAIRKTEVSPHHPPVAVFHLTRKKSVEMADTSDLEAVFKFI